MPEHEPVTSPYLLRALLVSIALELAAAAACAAVVWALGAR
jgi:hypothetical protein